MEKDKFLLVGEDKKTLASAKNALVSNQYIYIGYISEIHNVLRGVRSCFPDLILLDVQDKFYELKPILQVIDDELLSVCILLIKMRTDDIINFIKECKVMYYMVKPVHDDDVLHMAELSLLQFRVIHEYERKLKQMAETLESRKVIDKAKWLLVAKEGLTEAEAYEAIRKKSRDNRMPMKEIAQAIILALQ